MTANFQPSILDQNVIEPLKVLAEDDEGFLDEIYGSFFKHTPPRLKALRDAGAAKDLDRLKSLAHSLKGSASNLGAAALAEECRWLEGLLGAKIPDFSEIMLVITRLFDLYGETLRDLLQELPSLNKVDPYKALDDIRH